MKNSVSAVLWSSQKACSGTTSRIIPTCLHVLQCKPLNRAPSGIGKPAFFAIKIVSFTLGVHQYTYQYQGTLCHSRCEHCTQCCKRKLTVFLQYFCHNVLHSSCCGGHCSLLPLFSTIELVDFWFFYFIFCCLVNFLHFMISHALTACKPWCCYTSNCSHKRCACSNKRIIYKRKKIGLFFFSWNCSNKRFAL